MSEPISAIADAVSAVSNLITKSLPSDEERLQRLKLNYPRIYARIRLHILKQGYRYLKHHNGVSIDDYVKFVNGNLSDANKTELESILKSELSKNTQ